MGETCQVSSTNSLKEQSIIKNFTKQHNSDMSKLNSSATTN